jgi:hypothetical protein
MTGYDESGRMLNRERAEYCTCTQHRNSYIAVVFTCTGYGENAWPKYLRIGDMISFMPCIILTVSHIYKQMQK